MALALCGLLTSCDIDSVNPLSSPDQARPDQRLMGNWRGKKDQDTFRFSMKNTHWMHVVITPRQTDANDESSKIDRKPEEYDLFPTVIDKNAFLNVLIIDKDDQGNATKRYIFVRYSISSGHVLEMWKISQDTAATLVRTGKLKGIVHQDPHPLMVGKPPHPDVDVTLQDTSGRLAEYLRGADIKSLFSDKLENLYPLTSSNK